VDQALTGVVFVLKSGIPWEMLPKEMGCGSGMTCWQRLKEWQEAGVRERLHLLLLDRLGEADQIDWSTRWRGFRSTADSRFATSAGTTSMRRFSILVAH
jgi:transposase